MAGLSQTVITLISNTSAVTNVVSSRFYTLRAPQNTAVPFLVISSPNHTTVSDLNGPSNLNNTRIRFDLFGLNYSQLDQLRWSIMAMMKAATSFGATHVFGTEIFEDDTRYFHLVDDYSVWSSV